MSLGVRSVSILSIATTITERLLIIYLTPHENHLLIIVRQTPESGKSRKVNSAACLEGFDCAAKRCQQAKHSLAPPLLPSRPRLICVM